MVVMALPEEGAEYQESSVSLMNEGGEDVLITGLELTEDDDSPELSLLDADDWTGRVSIAPGERRTLRIGWRVLDAHADTGSITLRSNDGPRRVEIETADPDPNQLVTLSPSGEVSSTSAQLMMNEAVAGGFQRVVVTLNSISGAPLTVDRLCWVTDGDCVEQTFDSFRVCHGAEGNSERCEPVSALTPLPVGAAHSVSVLFTPPEGPSVRKIGRLRIFSDASNAPDFLIVLTGETCVRSGQRPLCGLCGDGEVDTEVGERCDDGNFDDSDDCDLRCQPTCAALGTCDELDSDGDGVLDGEDNCYLAPNPTQEDCDGDGRGDICDEDPCPASDLDVDGVSDELDNCPEVSNPDQADCDADGRGDACDPDLCGPDEDHDQVLDSEDNCPNDPNSDQADADQDGAGDVCDPMPEVVNHILVRQGFIQAGGVVTGDRFRLKGTLSSGAHQSFGEIYLLRGAFKP